MTPMDVIQVILFIFALYALITYWPVLPTWAKVLGVLFMIFGGYFIALIIVLIAA
jgi:nucleoside permease NupC